MSLTPNKLIVSAVPFEVQPLQDLGLNIDYFFVGIGPINAAKSAAALAEKARGCDVVFVGTSGIAGPFTSPRLVVAERVIWSPVCERHGLAYTVKNSAPEIILPAPLPFALQLPKAAVLVSPTISLVESPVSKGLFVENLELYSIAEELKSVSRSLTVILCITNSLGKHAHSEWQLNFRNAANITCDFLLKNWVKL